jgi:ribosomal protein L11 methyltransferase
MEIHSRLLLRPSWSKRRPKRGQLLVELDPGLSFGTGQHPTTAYCLREIIRAQEPGKAQSLLDLGTGSGVLAIAAARLGYTPIHACDFDADAVRIARSNAKRNEVPLRINFSHADVTRLTTRPKTRFSVVCANLISTLLVEQTRRILCQLAPGGVLILAGILKSEFKIVSNAYERAGLTLRRSHVSGEWRSGTWVWKKI